MSKIILLVGEHRNEVLAAQRAHEIKPLLEAKGHTVLIRTVTKPNVYGFGVKLSKAKTKSEAFKIIEEFYAEERVSARIVGKHAEKNPDAHVFSMHATPYRKTAQPQKKWLKGVGLVNMPEASVNPDAKFPLLNYFERVGSLLKRHSIIIETAHSDGAGGRKAIGIIENIADFSSKISSRQSFSTSDRVKKCREFIRQWMQEKEDWQQGYDLMELLDKYLRRYAVVKPRSYWLRKEHGIALANKIHELVTQAESVSS